MAKDIYVEIQDVSDVLEMMRVEDAFEEEEDDFEEERDDFIMKLMHLLKLDETFANCRELCGILDVLRKDTRMLFGFNYIDPNTKLPKAVHLTFASVALAYHKTKFFEVITDSAPAVLCLTEVHREGLLNMKVISPLIIAIHNRIPIQATTVLRNMNFFLHEFEDPKAHKLYMERCIEWAEACYRYPRSAEELTILSDMREAASSIRM